MQLISVYTSNNLLFFTFYSGIANQSFSVLVFYYSIFCLLNDVLVLLSLFHYCTFRNLKRMSSDGNSFSTGTKTIDLCISNLSAEMKEKYKDFALFVEDVNIKTEVCITFKF